MKTFKNSRKAGISLVALVITIIVLIILTGAVIVTFMEGGIIDRAKEAVFKNDMRTYQEILALKRAENQMEIALGEKDDIEINASTLAEIQAIIPEFKEEYEGIVEIIDGVVIKGERVTGDELSSSEELYLAWLRDLGIGETSNTIIVHNGIIPVGGIYYQGVTTEYPEYGDYTGATIYEAGDEFPEPQTGDAYVYGDYEYRYNNYYYVPCWDTRDMNGWGVVARNWNKTEYDEVLKTIAGKDLKCMAYTYTLCRNLTKAPIIPETVVYIESIFSSCTNLTGTIEINCEPESYFGAFYNTTKPITLTGSSTMLDEIAATAINEDGDPIGNVTVAQ